jgi:N4-gp56 family major capsid protein
MATSAYGVNHPMARRIWAKKLMAEALTETYMARFTGDTKDSLIYVKRELAKDGGDNVRYGLRGLMTGAGIVGDGTLEGNEESLSIYTDTVTVDQLRHAVRSEGRMSEHRVPFTVRDEAMAGLRDWWTDRMDVAFFNHVAGNTDQTNLAYAGHNSTLTPSSLSGNTRILYGDGNHTTENSISASATASNVMRLTFIDRMVRTAKTATPVIRPINIGGGQKRYVVFLHPFQVYALRTDATANRITWYGTQQAALQGGKIAGNPIFTGAIGEYNECILHESTRIPLGASQTTVRRAVLCGAQAACLALSKGNKGQAPNQMTWVEELFDYENQLGVSAGMIWGLKKSSFTIDGAARDFATVVQATHATAS